MAEPQLEDELLRDRARIFELFLKDYTEVTYDDAIVEMLNNETTRLLVRIDDVRRYRRDLADGWVFVTVSLIYSSH